MNSRKLVVRSALAASSTVAVLVGAQTLMMQDAVMETDTAEPVVEQINLAQDSAIATVAPTATPTAITQSGSNTTTLQSSQGSTASSSSSSSSSSSVTAPSRSFPQRTRSSR